MLDRTIPFYNTILRCDRYLSAAPVLHNGYQFRMYQNGDERKWAQLEYEIGDFDSVEEAEQYFISTYCSNKTLDITKRCVFAVNEKNEIVGSCIAWKDLRNDTLVASLHWLVVSTQHQGKGIGKALCQKAMQIFLENDEFPVYIHTQPWSYKAIILYVRQGFKIQKTDTFSQYENQFDFAMNTLKKILPEDQYNILVTDISELAHDTENTLS